MIRATGSIDAATRRSSVFVALGLVIFLMPSKPLLVGISFSQFKFHVAEHIRNQDVVVIELPNSSCRLSVIYLTKYVCHFIGILECYFAGCMMYDEQCIMYYA
jgi:hypothetical protein